VGGKGTTTPVELARTLVGLLARAFPDRAIHLVADAAYHGKPLQDLPGRVTWTTRIQRNGVLYQPAPAPTGKRGRPRTKGERIGTPAQAAAGAAWRQAAVARYGRTGTVRIAEVVCLWYGAFGKRTGRLIAAAEGAGEEGRQLLLFTTDLAAPPNRSSPGTPPGGASRSPSRPRRGPWASARPATASKPPCSAPSPLGCSP
jgi:hypothetical protein